MSDEQKPATPDQEAAATVSPATGQRDAQKAAAAAASTEEHLDSPEPAGDDAALVAALSSEVETLKGQVADLTGRMLRAHADLDNLRKRAEREKQETARYAISKFARDTVEVADNFARAIAAVPAVAVEQNEHLKALLEGVTMTERAFIGVLERHGVKQVTPTGEPFNPHLHQAVMERADPSIPAGTVVEVFQAGYVIEDRCLRPAVVVVATGGPKAARPAAEKSAAEQAGESAKSDTGTNSDEAAKAEGNDGEQKAAS
jgi:molecular chaperone GrpE